MARFPLITLTTIPCTLWESEVWWTEAGHIALQPKPAFNCLARHITRLPSHNRIPDLLGGAGLPQLEEVLDSHTRKSCIRLPLATDEHPCNQPLLTLRPHLSQREDSPILDESPVCTKASTSAHPAWRTTRTTPGAYCRSTQYPQSPKRISARPT